MNLRGVMIAGMLMGAAGVSLLAAEPAVRGSASTGPLGGFSGALVTRHSEHLLAPQSPTQAARLVRTRAQLLPEKTLPRFDSTFDRPVPTKLLEPTRTSDSKPLWSEGSRLPRDR